jgi:uncharacterized hydrophobic protein (TIGR00271 family)
MALPQDNRTKRFSPDTPNKMSLPINKPPSIRVRLLFYWRKLVAPISRERRGEIQVLLRQSCKPNFDFFLLVFLSCTIATLGLLVDSAAVIIGAMLVAPLMSPIIGLGLSSITGDERLLKDAALSLLTGAFVAIALALLITLTNSLLPFVPLQEPPGEVLARTRPTPIDLGIALAGGIAAAYAIAQPHISAALPGVAIATALMPPLCTVGIELALGRWENAGGASLLFVTNAVTIAFAATLVFFALGFRTRPRNGERGLPRSLGISAGLTMFLLIPLAYYSVTFVREGAENRTINEVVRSEVAKFNGAELVDLSYRREVNQEGETFLNMDLTVRTSQSLRLNQVQELQKNIADSLSQADLSKPAGVAVVVNQVIAERLDPLIPPTPTATYTPGPSPTATVTTTHTPTVTPSPTETLTPTNTATVTHTPTSTPTPASARLLRTPLPALELVQFPGGPVIATLRSNQVLLVLYGRQEYAGLMYLQVEDEDGRIGWVPEIFIFVFTPTPSTTLTPTP